MKVMTRHNQPQGFTLIELLIVIGVLGILAAGLLAAVDPFEQLKKGRDSNTRNQVVELHNGFIRYYATHGDLPWNDDACVADFTGGPLTLDALNTAGCIDPLISDGELKPDFMSAVGSGTASNIYVNSPSAVSLSICFEPTSKSVFADAGTRYSQDGQTDLSATTCTTENKSTIGPGTGSCYWCAK